MSASVHDPFGVARDAAMPFLARSVEPEEVEPRLVGALAPAECRLLGIRVARYKPGRRCLIEYDIELRPRGGFAERATIIGKTLWKGSPKWSDQLLRALWLHGFATGAADGISVPEPLGVIPEYGMSLQRKAPGMPARAALESGGTALAGRIAEALCKLHRAGVPSRRRPHRIDDELQILRDRLGRLARTAPEWRPRLEGILRDSHRLAARLPEPSARGIHRDFYAEQLIVDGSRLCLVDFDLYCEGDPALDAGNFIGHLIEDSLRRSGRADARRNLEEAFAERFLQLSDGVAPESLEIYTTLTLVRHIELSTRFPERQPFTQALIALCEERLAAGSRVGAEVTVS